MEFEDKKFPICQKTLCYNFMKGHMTLWLEASNPKSPFSSLMLVGFMEVDI